MTEAHDAPVLVWFRDDLRLSDNPALSAAHDDGRPLAFVYVFDEVSAGIRPLGGAARWWLHHSLEALAASLASLGHRLILRRGAGASAIQSLACELGAAAVFWNRRYGEAERAVDAALKARLKEKGVDARSFQANLLFEPWTILTKSGQPFRVFTPFWRAAAAQGAPRQPLPRPQRLGRAAGAVSSDTLDDWTLLPRHPDWAGGLRATWAPGEAGAAARLEGFLDHGLAGYAGHRDEPAIEATSRLSPHLRFGEISPFQLWHAVEAASHASARPPGERGVAKFQSELGWREFNWHILFHNGDLATRNLQPKFDAFPWKKPDPALLRAWQQGRTGLPIVDAGMRQLWTTGWMHNRVRMITASFLVKNLMIDWRIGEAWFWDCLVDADGASNPGNWQWVAGSGADAAPYFRIFNPLRQGATFDPKGDYVRAHVPELAGLAGDDIHATSLAAAPGYPAPIVDLAESRRQALAAFASLGGAEQDGIS